MPSSAATTVLVILAAGTIIATAAALQFLLRYSRKLEDADWELGVSYLVKEKGAERGTALFQRLLEDRDGNGIVITRTFPEKLQRSENFKNAPIWWLSREESPQSIDPLSLAKLTHVVQDFMRSNKNPVILLDGLEYLILQNDFETVLRFIQSLNDLVTLSKATLIVPVDPSSLSVKELSLLEKEMEIHRLSMSILRFFGD